MSCTRELYEQEQDSPIPEGSITIDIEGNIDQVAVTRANDDGFCDGDGIGVYVVNNVEGLGGTLLDTGNQANNVRYVFNESEYKWTPDYPVYYRDDVTPVDIIGYYPYDSSLESVRDYAFEVRADQSEESAMGGYEASDFLWGKVENITPTTSRVKIVFYHRMAGVQVELTEGDGWNEGEWAALQKQALVASTIRKASVDLSSGIVTPSGEVEFTDIVPAVTGECYRAVVVPQRIPASVALLRITVDGTPYVFRKNVDFEYQAGKLHKFTIEVSKKDGSGVELGLVNESITPWESETISHDGSAREYVVVKVPVTTDRTSGLKTAIEQSGKDSDRIVNMKVVGCLTPQDFNFMRNEMLSLSYLNLAEAILCDEDGIRNNTVPDSAFAGTKKFQNIILPESVEVIGTSSFYSAEINSVNIPDSVKIIKERAFQSAKINNELTIPSALELIESRAFNSRLGKIKFRNFFLPESVREIGSEAFTDVHLDCELKLPENLQVLGSRAFVNCGLTGSLKIPERINIISSSTFATEYGGYGGHFNNFTGTLELHDGIIEIQEHAFAYSNFTGELILPKSLVRIGSMAFGGCDFSGELRFPETITRIDAHAFWAMSNIRGTLEIPSGLGQVDMSSYPENVSKIIIPSDIRKISGSISGLYLKEIVCKSKIPPTLETNAFLNTSKGNDLTNMLSLIKVEVPEDALYSYQTAPYWGDYIPSVYRDFNIDNEKMAALNAGFSKKTIVRAPSDMEWSVVHKPDWVTVSPSSGTGKVEVAITFDELPRSSGNREDSIVFKPIAYDYAKVIRLDQYDYQYGDGDVITHQTSTKGKGVNIVFMGDCFDAKDIAQGYYEEIMNEAIGYFFAVEPYSTYREYFNVYTVVGHSPDSGLPTTYTINQESRFESQYAYENGGGFQFKINEDKCFEYACKAPTVSKENLCQTPVVVIENSSVYGGCTYLWDDNTALAVQCIMRNEYPFDFRGVIQHEVGGHAFGKLADEYVYHSNFIDLCHCSCCDHANGFITRQNRGWYRNLSLNTSHYDVPWSHLIFDPQYQMYVDMYEGGYFHQRGVYRSEPNSCMNNNIPYYSAISRQAIVERIMEYAGEEFTFAKFKANDSAEMGVIPATVTKAALPNFITVNPIHNEPKIVGEKPELNF